MQRIIANEGRCHAAKAAPPGRGYPKGGVARRAIMVVQSDVVTLYGRRMTAIIRPFAYGDMAQIVRAQTEYYDRAFGWRGRMERLLLQVCGDFLDTHVPGRTQCWVAEVGGEFAGSIFACDAGGNVAQLRLLHVGDAARGQGLGAQLVATCVDFARDAGYAEIMLWTHAVLLPARRLYAAAGFVVTETHVHDEFGRPEPGEIWRLTL
jgi:GNAT superfamily N-acetyltransferase